jgi:hypothetical protein
MFPTIHRNCSWLSTSKLESDITGHPVSGRSLFLPIWISIHLQSQTKTPRFWLQLLATFRQIRAECLLCSLGYRPRPGIQSPAACTAMASFSLRWIMRTTCQCPVCVCNQYLAHLIRRIMAWSEMTMQRWHAWNSFANAHSRRARIYPSTSRMYASTSTYAHSDLGHSG